MARLLHMPEVAANLEEAVLQEWLVTERQEFAADDAVATVETDKAVVDIEAGSAGVVLGLLVEGGAMVKVGAPIAILGEPGESTADLDSLRAELGFGGPDPDTEVPRTPAASTAPDRAVTEERRAAARIFTSPLARRLAQEAGLALGDLSGSGPRGRILKRDVLSVLVQAPTPRVPAPVDPPLAAELAAAGVSEVPHTRMRRTVAARLTESKQTAPHFYLRATLPVGELLQLRASLNAGDGPKVSVNDLVVKAVAAAHRRVPDLNVTWTPESVRQHAGVDVAVAVATEDGLLTPVVRGVDRLSVSELSAQVRDLAERAREGRLRQHELEGGTIAVSNLGMYGVEEFAAIINPPHAAILAVGAVREAAVVDDGVLDVGTVMTVTLSADHRPIDGVVAARWMEAFSTLVRHPVQILA